jgi:periplasmic protein TonB
MSRYFSSFFIAFSFYALFGIGVFYFLNNKKIIINEAKTNQILSLNHIELEKPIEKPVIEETIQKDIQEEKIEEKIIDIPKPIIKKKIIEKEKRVEKKKKIQKKEIVEKQENIVKNINENIEKTIPKIEKEITKQISQTPPMDDKKAYLDKHLIQIRNLINQNVKYPKRARKLSIEGIVLVQFKITKDGEVSNITIIDGDKFLQSATIEAIIEASKHFPKTNQSIEIQIPIEYKLI